ncbi:FMN-binding glutamate synthase family protein [Paracoccaceae bacterium]|nr:FMN-binding glutamate synthase family protein [Paracoccaceae bacterium]
MEFVWGRYSALFYTGAGAILFIGLSILFGSFWFFLAGGFLFLFLIGITDYAQKKRAVLGNFPLMGRFRFIFEAIRPELRQYFWEADNDELPYSRNQRAMVYQRSKEILAARPFGSDENQYLEDFNWLNHSISPSKIEDDDFRIRVGEGKNLYNISVLNISGTSFGSISPKAIQSFSAGAKKGGFAHNTGEGSLSKYHEQGGGDTIWQISTGYFGCRNQDGTFDEVQFAEKAKLPQVKMIEIKLSQGAKPGHGGMLLGAKVSPEIAETRNVPVFEDVISPHKHSEFSTPAELLTFADKLRNLSNGKPVGIKLCIGHPWEFVAIVKAMVQTNIHLDFITVDGSEGGTGAAPVEFTDHLGSPLRDALVFVDNALIGAGLRDRVKVAASGKIVSAYDIARVCAIGADWCNMARPFMFSVGCIQARDCASGHCPTGVATMDPKRYRVIDVKDRAERVYNFQKNTRFALKELLEAAGLNHPNELNRRHIVRRLSASQIKLADQIYPKVENGALLRGEVVEDARLSVYWDRVDQSSFKPVC